MRAGREINSSNCSNMICAIDTPRSPLIRNGPSATCLANAKPVSSVWIASPYFLSESSTRRLDHQQAAPLAPHRLSVGQRDIHSVEPLLVKRVIPIARTPMGSELDLLQLSFPQFDEHASLSGREPVQRNIFPLRRFFADLIPGLFERLVSIKTAQAR